MNALLLVAAAILFFVAVMHSVLAEWSGDRRLVRRIVHSGLFDAGVAEDLLARQIVRLAWHLTSLAWCGMAAVLAYLSLVEQTRPVVVTIRILAVVFVLHAALSLGITRGRHSSWYLFLIVGTLSFLATLPFG